MKSFEIAPKTGFGERAANGVGSAGRGMGTIAHGFGGSGGAASSAVGGCGGKSGCGCKGGDCGGGGGATVRHDVMGRVLKAWELLPLAISSNVPVSVRSAGHGPPAPGARLCDALSREVQAIRDELQRRGARYGGGWDEVANAWEDARRTCTARDPMHLCAALGQAYTRSPLEGAGVATRNAIWHMWNACSVAFSVGTLNQGTLEGYRRLACLAALHRARDTESRVRSRLGNPDLSYERDIAPLVARLASAERALRECFNPTSGSLDWPFPRPPNYENCRNVGWLRCPGCCTDECGENQGCYDDCTKVC